MLIEPQEPQDVVCGVWRGAELESRSGQAEVGAAPRLRSSHEEVQGRADCKREDSGRCSGRVALLWPLPRPYFSRSGGGAAEAEDADFAGVGGGRHHAEGHGTAASSGGGGPGEGSQAGRTTGEREVGQAGDAAEEHAHAVRARPVARLPVATVATKKRLASEKERKDKEKRARKTEGVVTFLVLLLVVLLLVLLLVLLSSNPTTRPPPPTSREEFSARRKLIYRAQKILAAGDGTGGAARWGGWGVRVSACAHGQGRTFEPGLACPTARIAVLGGAEIRFPCATTRKTESSPDPSATVWRLPDTGPGLRTGMCSWNHADAPAPAVNRRTGAPAR